MNPKILAYLRLSIETVEVKKYWNTLNNNSKCPKS